MLAVGSVPGERRKMTGTRHDDSCHIDSIESVTGSVYLGSNIWSIALADATTARSGLRERIYEHTKPRKTSAINFSPLKSVDKVDRGMSSYKAQPNEMTESFQTPNAFLVVRDGNVFRLVFLHPLPPCGLVL